MKRNMKQWIADTIAAPQKTPIPVLSFPSIQLMDITVKELISSADAQTKGMVEIANRVRTGAAVSLMDLSVEAECFGTEIRVSDDEVPTVVGSMVSTPAEADALAVPPMGAGRTDMYVEAVRNAAQKIQDRPVFGGIIGPFSLAGRLMDVTEAMLYCYDEPEMVQTVLQKATDFLISYAQAFKDASADGVVMAEPLAGLLSPALMEEFSTSYVKQIVDAVQDDSFILVYHNCGPNTVDAIDTILKTGAPALHFGDSIQMADIAPKIPADRVFMGNVSPAHQFRNGTPESVRKETLDLMEKCSGYKNFVPSSGCDIPPLSPWENIDAFFAAVDEFYGRQ